jgi:hypothetical protein
MHGARGAGAAERLAPVGRAISRVMTALVGGRARDPRREPAMRPRGRNAHRARSVGAHEPHIGMAVAIGHEGDVAPIGGEGGHVMGGASDGEASRR